MNNGMVGVSKGWSISHKFDFGWAFLGPGWFDWKIPSHALGIRTSVFTTRKEAVEALKKIRVMGNRGKFRIIRVLGLVVEMRHLTIK